MKSMTNQWLEFAHKDLLACQAMAKQEYLLNIAAFHAQQCVEKAFKAILVEQDLPVPKIHSLMSLFDKIAEMIDFSVDDQLLDLIDKVYIEARYPVGLGMLPSGMPSVDLVNQMCDFAEYIYTNVVRLLASRS